MLKLWFQTLILRVALPEPRPKIISQRLLGRFAITQDIPTQSQAQTYLVEIVKLYPCQMQLSPKL